MRNFILILLLGFFSLACTDDLREAAKSSNSISARIDSVAWNSASGYSQRSLNEDGPLTIIGTGDGYTIEIVLGDIHEPGEYDMGTSRTGKIKSGNYTYSTLDVQNAGKIVVSSLSDNRIVGSFYFDAQWLSANNRIQVSEGKFDMLYY